MSKKKDISEGHIVDIIIIIHSDVLIDVNKRSLIILYYIYYIIFYIYYIIIIAVYFMLKILKETLDDKVDKIKRLI